jgi:hypothetical protein
MVVVADGLQVDDQRLMAVNAQRRAAKKAPSALCANQSRNTRRAANGSPRRPRSCSISMAAKCYFQNVFALKIGHSDCRFSC